MPATTVNGAALLPQLFAPVVGKGFRRRLASRSTWTLASALAQAALALALVAVSARLASAPEKEVLVPVKLVRPAPPPAARPGPPPPPAAALAPRPPDAPRPKVVRRPAPAALIQPREVPRELKKPDPAEPWEEEEYGTGEEGVGGGVPGGVVEAPAAVAAILPAPPPPKPVKYDARMTAPVLVSSPPLEYTQQALEREVQGTMLVECVVDVDGSVHACKALRSLPFMDRAVIGNLERRRYRPATLGGRPLAVQYTFVVKFELPQ